MHRYWIGIRASAGLTILGSLLAIAFAGLMLLSTVLKPPPASAAVPQYALAVIGAVIATIFVAFGVWGISTGIAIFCRRGWARVSTLVFAAILIFFAASACLAMVFAPFPAQAVVAQRTLEIVRAALVGFYALLTVIGIWWLVLFNLKSTREYFERDAPAAPSARPLSVSVIGWYLLTGALFCLGAAVMRWPAFVFGTVLVRWGAVTSYVALFAAQGVLGAGLLKLREPARVAAIAYFGLMVLNCALALAPPGFAANVQIVQNEMPQFFRTASQGQVYSPGWTMALPGIALAVVPIWLLVRQRAAFEKTADAPQTV